MERIIRDYPTANLAVLSQAQFYFDALWAGALGLTQTLGQSMFDQPYMYMY